LFTSSEFATIPSNELSKVFLDAHKRGIIGVTCYRDGSRDGILVHNNEKKVNDIGNQ
jgi:ribonucleotide reductase alpha subunit